MRRVGKGCSWVETPLFKGMLVAREPKVQGDDVQDQSIPSPTLPPQPPQDILSTSQIQSPTPAQPQGADFPMSLLQEGLDACGTMIDELDRDEGAALMGEKEKEKKAEEVKDIAGDEHVKGRQAQIYQIDMDHAAKVLRVVIRDPEEESSTKTLAETKSKDKGKGIMVEEPKPMKKKEQVEMDEAYARKLHEELNQDIDWDVAIDHVKQKAKEDPLQALVDRKKMVITEAAIKDVLSLDDAEGVDCLPNEEIFAELARMGYEKPRVGKGFLGVETPLFEGMLVAGEPEEQGDAEEHVQGNDNDATQGAETAVSGDDVQDQSIPSPTPPTSPLKQPQDFPSTSQVQHTPPQSPPPQPQFPSPAQPQAPDFPMSLLQEALDACAALTRRVEHLERDKVAQALEITMLKKRVKKLEKANKVKVLKLKRLKKVGTSQRIESSDDIDMEDAPNQGRMIADLDRDKGVALMDDEETEKKAEDAQVADDEQVKGRQVEIYQIDMDHASKFLSMQEDEPKVQEVVEVDTTAKLITKVVAAVSESVSAASATIAAIPAATITAAPVRVAAASTRRRKGVVIRDPKEESTAIIPAETKSKDKGKELNKDIDWDVAIDHVKQKAKEDSLDYFKGMSYDDMRPIFEDKFNSNIEFLLKSKEKIEEEENRAIESINETPAQKVAKRRKLNEEVKELKQHLEIVPDEDDDVYTEATPLSRKVPVVDYKIIHFNNKPHYKIIRADGTHQLYVSFITLLKNFDREDLESL
nr:hypothetical protein [Tanacetum cinerariifolium]